MPLVTSLRSGCSPTFFNVFVANYPLPPSPATKCRVELTSFAVRMVMTFANVFITSNRWYSLLQLFLSFILVYLYLKWLPHYYDRINHIRVATYCGESWMLR